MNQRTIEIKIQNQLITLKTSDSAQLAEHVRNLVQNRVNDIENRSKPGVSPVYIATLALVEAIEDGLLSKSTVSVAEVTHETANGETAIDIDYTGQLPFNASAAV